MDLLFIINSAATAGKEKVGDTNFQEHYPSVNMNMAWKEISPYVRQATQRYIIPAIGYPLYNDLATKIQAETVLTAQQAQLVEMLRDAVANFTVAIALPKKKTMLSSMGALENTPTDNSGQSSLWGFKTTLAAADQDAWKALDTAMELLESYKAIPYFELWRNDPSYEIGSTDFFRQVSDFQKFASINSSRRTFNALQSIIQEVCETKIKGVLCKDQYADIKAKLRSTANLSAADTELVAAIRRMAAKWTVYEAADALPILPEQDGFRVISATDVVDPRYYSVETLKGAILGIKEQAEGAARTAHADLIGLLYDNKDSYPLWRDSACCAKVDEGTSLYCPADGAVML